MLVRKGFFACEEKNRPTFLPFQNFCRAFNTNTGTLNAVDVHVACAANILEQNMYNTY